MHLNVIASVDGRLFVRPLAAVGLVLAIALGVQHAASAQETSGPAPTTAQLIERAEAGSTDALVPLGFAYLRGEGVARDRDAAVDLMARAVEAHVDGAGGALVAAGYSYLSNDVGAPDPERGAAVFKRAADLGVDAALVPLGLAYLSGTGVDQDLERAGELLLEALEAGVPDAGGALVAIAYGMQSGEGGAPDPAGAAGLFERAVEFGSVEALVPLGFAYMTGNGVPADVNRAGELMASAVAAGVPDAGGALLAVAYGMQAGEIGPADPSGAALLFERAAALGVNEALVPLGFAYLAGSGVAADLDRAAELMARAVGSGVADAGGALLAVAYELQDKDQTRAAAIFQQAVDLGVSDGLIPLGFAYLNGNGVKADKARAQALMTRAVQDGVVDAGGALLAVAYSVQEEDPAQSIGIFTAAAELGVNDALLPLGFAYLGGSGVAADADHAAELVLDALHLGVDGAAGAVVGIAYGIQAGEGGARDPERAAKMFEAAAATGDGSALLALGFAHYSGLGVRRSAELAKDYFAQAAAAGATGGGTMLVNVDANAYVRFMQKQLAERGFLSGRAGIADQRTISAFLEFCRKQDIYQACQDGPLAPTAIESIIKALHGQAGEDRQP